jgi:uncharacterized protein (DUF111 family)
VSASTHVEPTRLIHLDAVGGVAGDMFVGAMLDALPELVDIVLADVRAVLPAGCGEPEFSEGFSGGIRARRFGLRGAAATPGHELGAAFADLRERIAAARLLPGAAEEAIAILSILAEAEARIHGVPVAEVHFHELGDWDSLMDVVAAGSIAAALRPERWTVSDLPRGGGVIRTAHGLLPAPHRPPSPS